MGMWAVSRYQDVEYVFKNPQLFSSAGFETLLKPAWLPHNPLADSILTKDGPGHTKLRALLSHAFAPAPSRGSRPGSAKSPSSSRSA